MYVKRAAITNFKSFGPQTELVFGPGVNVVVGANNAGKSALLEALSLRFGNQPNVSIRTKPTPQARPGGRSIVEVDVAFERGEFMQLLRDELVSFGVPGRTPEAYPEMVATEFEAALGAECVIRATFVENTVTAHLLSYQPANQPYGIGQLRVRADGRGFDVVPNGEAVQHRNYGEGIAAAFRDRIHALHAERFHIGECAVGTSNILAPQASNLGEVLNKLQANPVRFAEYNGLVREVFPHIRQVTVVPVEGNRLRVMIWTIDPASKREDLAMPLGASGTGVSQVLAMLYLVVNVDVPRLVLIDEPQSFLHPGALRALLRALSERSDHQYILTTHSPIPLTETLPSTVSILTCSDNETAVRAVDASEADSAWAILQAVGARLSDVFGYEAILWVEGRTEEVCFPIILQSRGRRFLHGVGILGVVDTGALEKGDPERILKIYSRLSAGGALIPFSVGFIVDRECRSDEQIAALLGRAGGGLQLLRRRMFENYLLHDTAIAMLINALTPEREREVQPEEIHEWMLDAQSSDEYMPNDKRTLTPFSDAWYVWVDGARLLRRALSYFSEGRVEYDKVRHGEMLTKQIVKLNPEVFDEVAQLLEAALGRSRESA